MIVKLFIDFRDSSEQNVKMLSQKIVREEFMHIPEYTQIPPEWVSKWK